MKRLYRVTCLGCQTVFRAFSFVRLGEKIGAHCCWSRD